MLIYKYKSPNLRLTPLKSGNKEEYTIKAKLWKIEFWII